MECPKCSSRSARLVDDGQDISIKCICGYLKVVQSRLQSIVIYHTDSAETVVLPKKNTKLWRVLTILATLEPATSKSITDRLNLMGSEIYQISDVSTQLVFLRYRKLAQVKEDRRRKSGGSVWELSLEARRFLKDR